MGTGFVDTHIHILPGLDDGVGTLEMACRMAQMATGDGITSVVATPHCLDGPNSFAVNHILAAVDFLQQELDRRGIDLTVYPGAELHSHRNLRALLDQGQVLTMGVGNYVLLKWPIEAIPTYMDHLVFELMVGGYTPIIAHPERHPEVQSDPNVLYDYLERGALAQVTAGSITGLYGERVQSITKILLCHGMAQLIATDAHSLTGMPVISDAYHVATKWLGQEEATKLVVSNPRAILDGAAVKVRARAYEGPRWQRWFRPFGLAE